MQKTAYKSLITLLLILFYSCSDDQGIEKSQTGQIEIENNPVIKRILSAGFKKNDIVEYTDRYVVEGDIAFYKKDPAPARALSNGREQQARANYLMNSYYASDVKVFLNQESFSSIDLNNVLNVTIAAFNEHGPGIHMSRVYSAVEANIEIIKNDFIGYNVCGEAGFPFADGRPFNRVNISELTLLSNGLTEYGQLIQLVAHELGHCIGLRHTNWQARGEEQAIHIDGTPGSDTYSVMNGGSCGSFWNGFTYYDAVAIKILYPDTTPPTGGSDKLLPNQQLAQGESIQSTDGRFTLLMQHDGNLVLYFYNQPLWSSGTCCDASVNRCIMQGDGNLVVYDAGNAPRFHTNTWMYPGSYLVMQNDGHLVIYQGSTPRWWSGTCCY